MARTPAAILTGFLGSGKTTLLNSALRDPLLARTALVINEFGAISLDLALATASDDTIVVLENGCLCCTVFGDLVGRLNNLAHRARRARFQHSIKWSSKPPGSPIPCRWCRLPLEPTMPSLNASRDRLLAAIANGHGARDWSVMALEQARASGLAQT